MTRRRTALVALVAVGVLVTAAWYGDLASAIPLDLVAARGDEPLLQPPEVALHLAEREIFLHGGMPHDALLSAFRAQSGPTAAVTGYDFIYHPLDVVGGWDRIMVHVGANPVRTCLDSGTLSEFSGPQSCGHYRLTSPPHVTWLVREWHPRAVRALTRWRSRAVGPMIATPSSVETGCAHLDEGAMRRIVAARWDYLQLKGRFDAQSLWKPTAAAARDGRGAILTWAPPYPTVRFRPWRPGALDHVDLRQAIVLDGPVGERSERLILVKYVLTGEIRRDAARRRVAVLHDVDAVISTDDEPVCPPVRDPSVALPSAAPPAWEHIMNVVRARAEDEGRWLVRSPRQPVTNVVGTDRHAGGTSTVDVETSQGQSRWRGRYTIDDREPAIREAEYALESVSR